MSSSYVLVLIVFTNHLFIRLSLFDLLDYFVKLHCFCLFVFVALRPMSTAMVIAGWSVHLTTFFPGQA